MTNLLDLVRGCTFDDFLFTPQYSILERRDPAAIDLSCRLSEHLTLKRPIVSANMDTITRAEMAIAVAEEGGIGIIDRGFRSGDIEPQVREVERVKRRQHGVVVDRLAERGGRTNRVRVDDNPVLPPFDAFDFAHLRLDVAGAEATVDDADPALFGDGDRHLGARN